MTDKPAKRGPGRPRKNPLPDALPPLQTDPIPAPKDEDVLDWASLLYDVVVEYDAPISAADIANVTGRELAKVTSALDDLVTDGRLVLGDDDLYRQPAPPGLAISVADAQAAVDALSEGSTATPDMAEALAGIVSKYEVTIEGEYDDKQNVVYLPSSDIVAFLKNINLPPHLTAGFGVPSEVHGFIDFEDAVPAEGETQASGAFRVVLYGKHLNTTPLLNPNQPGYESQIQRATAPQDLTAGAVGE